MEVILIVLVGLATLVYLYLRHHYSYWRRKGLPQPPTVLGFGNLFDAFLMKDHPGLIYHQIYRSYDRHDAVGVYGFHTPKLLVRNPALVQRVLVSDFSSFHDNEFFVTKKLDPHFYLDPFCLKGEEWKIYRAKLITSMSQVRMKEIFPLMKEIIPRLDAYVNDHLGKDLEAKELATLFTMDNVSNTVFGISSNCFNDPDAAFRQLGNLFIKEQMQGGWKAMVLFNMPRIRDFIGLRFVPTKVNIFVEKMMEDVSNFRIRNNISRSDLFQYFMKKDSGSDSSDMMLYGMTFFLEGFETSSMVASTALYELALNPDVQQTLYDEIHGAFGDKCEPDYDALNSLTYLDKVLQEALRKYPVMFAYARECTRPVTLEIDGKPVDIEHGTPVIIPVYSLHHDARYYPDPEVFDPERFSEESKASRPQYTYLPFGEGPRICPGTRFGLMQVKLFIANIVYKYKILRCERTPDRLTFDIGSQMVTPLEKEWVRLEKRK